MSWRMVILCFLKRGLRSLELGFFFCSFLWVVGKGAKNGFCFARLEGRGEFKKNMLFQSWGVVRVRGCALMSL